MWNNEVSNNTSHFDVRNWCVVESHSPAAFTAVQSVFLCFVEEIIGEVGPTDSVYFKYVDTITQFRSIATAVTLIIALKNTLIF